MYLAKCKYLGDTVVIKVVTKKFLYKNLALYNDLITEVQTLGTLDHAHIT